MAQVPKRDPVLSFQANRDEEEVTSTVIAGLKHCYSTVIRPLEELYRFELFHSLPLNPTDFDAAPMVLLMGQYSTGKTSFIHYLVEREFIGMRIGPEPTTDRFTVLMHGQEENVIPGHAFATMSDRPFLGVQQFGSGFLNRFECVTCNSPILSRITLIDTPGVLSGEKQRIGRTYSFREVIRWFAQKVDRILLLFDAHKLDISDEFKESIEALDGNDDKIRCILNKADTVSTQQLMRVYGALMWSLGKVIKSPEVVRVYIGSFWNKPYQNAENTLLLQAEEADLISDLRMLPRGSIMRRINELLKRSKQALIHALIMAHMREQFGFFGKTKKQTALLNDLPAIFKEVQQAHGYAGGDFPSPKIFKEVATDLEIYNLPKLDIKLLEAVKKVLSQTIPELMSKLPSQYNESQNRGVTGQSNSKYGGTDANVLQGGDDDEAIETNMNAFSTDDDEDSNPFAASPSSIPEDTWEIDTNFVREYTNQFYSMKLVSGKLSGAAARDLFLACGLSVPDLRKIWSLSDMDKDSYLDVDEFITASWLIDRRKRDPAWVLPSSLTRAQIPPSKRHFFPTAQ